MKLILLTDLHLTSDGARVGGRDPWRSLDSCLEHILAHHADAASAVIMGDLANDASPLTYERLRKTLQRLPFEVHMTLGNHDRVQGFGGVFKEQLEPEKGWAQKCFTLGAGWQGVTLDTSFPGHTGGRLDASRLDWLNRTLKQTEYPCLLFMHHPPIDTGLPGFDAEPLQGRHELAEILQRHPGKVRHLFFGHCHLPISGHWLGIPFSSIRGTNQASWANFADRRFLLASALPQAYGVILAQADTLLLHMIEFGQPGEIRPG